MDGNITRVVYLYDVSGGFAYQLAVAREEQGQGAPFLPEHAAPPAIKPASSCVLYSPVIMRLGHFIGILCLSGFLGMASTASTVHTVFPTECTKYFTWQSMGAKLGLMFGMNVHDLRLDVRRLSSQV